MMKTKEAIKERIKELIKQGQEKKEILSIIAKEFPNEVRKYKDDIISDIDKALFRAERLIKVSTPIFIAVSIVIILILIFLTIVYLRLPLL